MGLFLGPPERARAETGGADQWVLKRRELPGFVRVNQVTSASLGYPPSVFNKNSTLKWDWTEPNWTVSLGYPLSLFNKNFTLKWDSEAFVRSWCNWRASRVDSKPKKNTRSLSVFVLTATWGLINLRGGSAQTTIQREHGHGPIMPEVCVHECTRIPRGLRKTRARIKGEIAPIAQTRETPWWHYVVAIIVHMTIMTDS